MWLPIGLLILIAIYAIKHPPKKETSAEPPPPKIKITVSKKPDSVLSNLNTSSPEGVKGVQVAESEIEKWLKQNPSLRDANKL